MKTDDAHGMLLLLQPFRPKTGGWVERPIDTSRWERQPYVIERYYNRGQELSLLTSIEMVEESAGKPMRPEYHVSVSGLKWLGGNIHRVSDSRARWALNQFGFDGYNEDNHVPHGLVRNFWRPVADQFAGQICDCQAREPAIKEMKGDFVWRGA